MRATIGLGLALVACLMVGVPWLRGDLSTLSRTLALALPLGAAGIAIVMIGVLTGKPERPAEGLPPRRRRRAF